MAWLLLGLALAAWTWPALDTPAYDDTALGWFRAGDWWAELDPRQGLPAPWLEIAATVPHGWIFETSLAGPALGALFRAVKPSTAVVCVHLASVAAGALLGLAWFALLRPGLGPFLASVVTATFLVCPQVTVPIEVMSLELWVAALSMVALACLLLKNSSPWAAMAAAFCGVAAWAIHPLGVVVLLATACVVTVRLLADRATGEITPGRWFDWGTTSVALLGGILFWWRALNAPMPQPLISRLPLWNQSLGHWGGLPWLSAWVALAVLAGAVTRLLRPLPRAVGEGPFLSRMAQRWAERPLAVAGVAWLVGLVVWFWAIERQLVVRDLVLAVPWLALAAGWGLGAPRRAPRLTLGLVLLGLFLSLMTVGQEGGQVLATPTRDGTTRERNRGYRSDLADKRAAARALQASVGDRPLLIGYPWTVLLARPRLGYVERPLKGYAIQTTSLPGMSDFWEIFDDPPLAPVLSLLDHPAYRGSPLRIPLPQADDELLFEQEPGLLFYAKDLVRVVDSPAAAEEWYLREMLFDARLVDHARLVLLPYAQVLQRRGLPLLALELCRLGLGTAPDSADLRLREAELLLALGRADEALDRAGALLELEESAQAPDDSPERRGIRLSGHYLEGVAQIRRGQWASAAGAFEQMLLEDPDNPEARCQLGLIALVHNDLDGAAEHLTRATRARPDFAEAFGNLGVVRFRQGRLDEAEAIFREALRLSPQYLEAHNNLATVLLKLQRYQEAAEAFRRALAIDPGHAQARRGLAEAEAALAGRGAASPLKGAPSGP